MPIGAYTDVSIIPTCGLAGELGIIGHLDDPSTFYEPERIYAQLLWFRLGYVEYRFPNRLPPNVALDDIEVSFEVCSEAPLHHMELALRHHGLDRKPGDRHMDQPVRFRRRTWRADADLVGQPEFTIWIAQTLESDEHGELRRWHPGIQGNARRFDAKTR